MDDTFRLDLSDKDAAFIWEALYGFWENATKHELKLVVIRMTKAMFHKLQLGQRADDAIFEGATVVIDDTEFEHTIELRYGSIH